MPLASKVRYIGEVPGLDAGNIVYANSNPSTSRFVPADGSWVNLAKNPGLLGKGYTGSLWTGLRNALTDFPGFNTSYINNADIMLTGIAGQGILFDSTERWNGGQMVVTNDYGLTWSAVNGPGPEDFLSWATYTNSGVGDNITLMGASVLWCPVVSKYVFFVYVRNRSGSGNFYRFYTQQITCDSNWSNWTNVSKHFSHGDGASDYQTVSAFRTPSGGAIVSVPTRGVVHVAAGQDLTLGLSSWDVVQTNGKRLFSNFERTSFVAINTGVSAAAYFTSTNGTTWTNRTMTTSQDVRNACCNSSSTWLIETISSSSRFIITTDHVNFIPYSQFSYGVAQGFPVENTIISSCIVRGSTGPRFLFTFNYGGYQWVAHTTNMISFTTFTTGQAATLQGIKIAGSLSSTPTSIFTLTGPGSGSGSVKYIPLGPSVQTPVVPDISGKKAYMKV